MMIILPFFLLLVTQGHAGIIVPSVSNSSTTTTSPPSFNMTEELFKISEFCPTVQDRIRIAGNHFGKFYSGGISTILIEVAEYIIGLSEMRAAFGFTSRRPWIGRIKPSKEQLAAASTVEEYYELVEPRGTAFLWNTDFFFENNFPPAIEFLDEKVPSIRKIFKNRFEEILRDDLKGKISRESVDRMIEKFHDDVLPKVEKASEEMKRYRCLYEKEESLNKKDISWNFFDI